MGSKRVIYGLAACVVGGAICASTSAFASKGVWEEYEQIVRSAENVATLGPDLFGDQVNLQQGRLGFSVTDISLKGNSALSVALTRTFGTKTSGGAMKGTLPTSNVMDGALSDWEIDLPFIGGVFSTELGWVNSTYGKSAQRCSVAGASEGSPPAVSVGTNSFQAQEYWHGTRINIPGRGNQAMLVAHASSLMPSIGTTYWVTADQTSIGCLSTILNSSGEGFVATTPDGTRYWFNWMAAAHEVPLTKQRVTTGFDHLYRKRFGIYATRVEDRFGNWVTYTYTNQSSAPVRVSEINASDGRRITFTHNSAGFVQSASAHGRTWTYGYSDGVSGSLRTVSLPDGSAWSLDFGTLQNLSIRYYQGEPGEKWRSCGNPGDIAFKTYVGSVTHPSGATAEFTLEPRRFVRAGIYEYYPQNCALGNVTDSNDDSEWYPSAWDSYSVVRKQVSGPGMPTGVWSYVYSEGFQTEVQGPESYTRYTYGNTFRKDEGKLLKVERGASASQILSSEDYSYELAQSGMPYPTPLGSSPQLRADDFGDEYPRPQKGRVVTQQGTTFSQSVDRFDDKLRMLDATRSSSLGSTTLDTTEYFDDLSRWVLGQVKRSTSAGTEAVRTEFNDHSQPWRVFEFGKSQRTLTYHPDGTVATVQDGNTRTTTLNNWHRGIPKNIGYPDGTSESAAVDDRGWIGSVTDQNGFVTSYTYDPMGRLASVTQPTGDSVAWNTTTQVFAQVATSEYGIPAGHWRQTVSTGNHQKITYFDGFWRPLLVREYDSSDVAGTQRFNRFTYDHEGRVEFASYPSTGSAPVTGTWTEYDPLGRVTSVSQDSEHGPLITRTEYLAGFKTRVTNPRNEWVTTEYMAFDQPSTEWPVLIEDSAGRKTRIDRDAFGKPRSLARSGSGQ